MSHITDAVASLEDARWPFSLWAAPDPNWLAGALHTIVRELGGVELVDDTGAPELAEAVDLLQRSGVAITARLGEYGWLVVLR